MIVTSIKLSICIKAVSIGLLIIATSKLCPLDAHLNNWLYDSKTNNVSAIDFGRTIKITSDNISSLLFNFTQNGYKYYITKIEIKIKY